MGVNEDKQEELLVLKRKKNQTKQVYLKKSTVTEEIFGKGYYAYIKTPQKTPHKTGKTKKNTDIENRFVSQGQQKNTNCIILICAMREQK